MILVFFFFSILYNLSSCKAEQVFHLKWEEIAEKLRKRDIAFILEAPTQELEKFGQLYPSAAFYAGLLARSAESASDASGEDKPEHGTANPGFTLFEAALASPSVKIREAGAQELLEPVLESKILAKDIEDYTKNHPLIDKDPHKKGNDSDEMDPFITLQGAALYTLGHFNEAVHLLGGQKVSSSWDRAITMLAALGLQKQNSQDKNPEKDILREKLLGLLLKGVPDRAYAWAFRETQQQVPDFLTEAESAAIAGRLAVSRSSYEEGLRSFRQVLKQNSSLFFQYPELISDLGQSFQYTDSHSEGIPVFLEWDRLLQTGGADKEVTKDMVPHIRYRLLHFAGRMERRRGNYAKGIAYFQSALSFAPDPIQEDACIWYILDATWRNKRQDLLPSVYTYINRWHDPSYFADILDLLCSYLAVNRQWKHILELFSRIRYQADGATTAKYAYILGRAVSEGYIPVRDGLRVLNATDMGSMVPTEVYKTTLAKTFFRIAFEEKKASFYYRGLSASRLGERILPLSAEVKPAQDRKKTKLQDFPHSDQMELLLGFFELGAASYAMPYIRNVRDTLSIPELRVLAEQLAKHQHWIESIRLVSAYMDREDYVLSPEDLHLYYPRPFKDIIEENAREAGIPVEILYGLIRTESAFDPNIRSHAGAIGLSQLMPKTAEEEANRIRKQGGPNYTEDYPIDLRNPAINVHIGASYLSQLITLMESPMQALLAYNGGYTRVRRWRAAAADLPEDLFLETIELTETREYGKRVLAAAAAYGYLYFDLSIEAVVADIYK